MDIGSMTTGFQVEYPVTRYPAADLAGVAGWFNAFRALPLPLPAPLAAIAGAICGCPVGQPPTGRLRAAFSLPVFHRDTHAGNPLR